MTVVAMRTVAVSVGNGAWSELAAEVLEGPVTAAAGTVGVMLLSVMAMFVSVSVCMSFDP